VLLAHEIAQKEYANYLYIPTFSKTSDLNISDPFLWLKIKQQSKTKDPKELLSTFATRQTMGAYALFLEKASRYRTHPFVTPYESFIDEENLTKKATLYAIARQESKFIPSAISPSYALGAMQFMPFLARHYAKELKKEAFDLDMMFDPKVSVEFGKVHIDYLYRHLKHPLFVAYAYNGGIGLTRRKILPLFKRYDDPLLAMELIARDETREYGKKVLSNYIIYTKIFKQPKRLRQLLGLLKR